MSVPENARTKGKLEACVKAHDLACYTLQITTNKKNFPEQFQAALTDKIVSVALDIHTLAWSANNVLVNSPEDLAGLHFELNEKKTCIYPLSEGIDFSRLSVFLDGRRKGSAPHSPRQRKAGTKEAASARCKIKARRDPA